MKGFVIVSLEPYRSSVQRHEREYNVYEKQKKIKFKIQTFYVKTKSIS